MSLNIINSGLVFVAPKSARRFFVSATGYLCHKLPERQVILDEPINEVFDNLSVEDVRLATPAEIDAAGELIVDKDDKVLIIPFSE